MSDLCDRRVEFVYEAARLAAIAANAPIIPEPWAQRGEAFRSQMTDAVERQCEMPMSAEEAHGAWMQAYIDMGWRYGETRDPDAKTHPDMVPYRQLGQLERDKDEVFVALCEIARQWVYDADEPAAVDLEPSAESEDSRALRERGYERIHDPRSPEGE